jgi:mannose-6-phosphate isomerase-like protein (cupin superfamily)
MISRTHTSEPIKDNPHNVEVKKLYDDKTAQIMHLTLKQGDTLKPHITLVDVAFYVLEGEPTIHVGDESKNFPVDTLIESPADIVHYISNENEQDARILVIKAPRPEQATRIL